MSPRNSQYDHGDDTPQQDSVKWWMGGGLAVFITLFAVIIFANVFEWNADEDWQVCQYVDGSYRIVDTSGFYPQLFGQVWTYPKYLDIYFSSSKDKGEESKSKSEEDKSEEERRREGDGSIRVTFSDAGVGFTSHHMKLQVLPINEKQRILFHRHFAETGVEGMEHAIGQHLSTVLKNTGPMMTSSQHQAQRSAEFYQTVRSQLEDGLYGMEVVEQEVVQRPLPKSTDKVHQFSGTEHEIQVSTKIVFDKEGKAVLLAASPLKTYGHQVVQYSITGTKYDKQTRAQLSARSESYQLAEQAKAKVEAENQKTRLVIASGKSAVASVQAAANKEMKKLTVKAEQEVGVAKEQQKEQVSLQEQDLATVDQKVLETEQELEISATKVKQASFEAQKTLAMAEATRAQIEKGGAVAEIDQFVADQRRQQTAVLTKGIAKIPSPKTVVILPPGEAGAKTTGGITDAMIQLYMLRQMSSTSDSSAKK